MTSPAAANTGGTGVEKEMVGVAGFEPTTTSPPDWCATRLRYTPTREADYSRSRC